MNRLLAMLVWVSITGCSAAPSAHSSACYTLNNLTRDSQSGEQTLKYREAIAAELLALREIAEVSQPEYSCFYTSWNARNGLLTAPPDVDDSRMLLRQFEFYRASGDQEWQFVRVVHLVEVTP